MRLLSIDGGGIRGIIPAVVLAAVEERCGKPIAELFDVIAGTSTGGILACSLARPGNGGRPRYSARELIELYTTDGPKIFHRSLLKRVTSADGWIDERYDNSALRTALGEHLGELRLKDALCDLFVPAYELRLRQAFFFRSRRAAGRGLPPGTRAEQFDFALADVALATASAPTYFEPVEVHSAAGEGYALIDGGVFATNPAMCTYAEALARAASTDVTILSLGTGTQTPEHAISLDAARGWGQIEWARPVLDVIFDGVADTVDFELGQLLAGRYLRLQSPLRHAAEALDDASATNLANLRRDADELVAEHAGEIDALCARLS